MQQYDTSHRSRNNFSLQQPYDIAHRYRRITSVVQSNDILHTGLQKKHVGTIA